MKKDYIFIISGIILLVALLSVVIYSINFLFQNTTAALGFDFKNNSEIPRINFDGLKKLGLIK